MTTTSTTTTDVTIAYGTSSERMKDSGGYVFSRLIPVCISQLLKGWSIIIVPLSLLLLLPARGVTAVLSVGTVFGSTSSGAVVVDAAAVVVLVVVVVCCDGTNADVSVQVIVRSSS